MKNEIKVRYLKMNFKVEFEKIENMILTYVVRSNKTK